jgi:hypothetical protein
MIKENYKGELNEGSAAATMERRVSSPVHPRSPLEIHCPAAAAINNIRLYARAERSISASKVLQI